MNMRYRRTTVSLIAALLLAAMLPAHLLAQASQRLLGTVTAISGTTLTVKTDAGEQKQVEVPAEATIKRLEPGQKDLAAAPAIQFSDLAVGDRVLVRLDPNASTPQASLVVAMKQSDVAQKQEKDREAWQRGVAGLVKSVDPGSGVVVITTGAGPMAKTVTVHTTPSTVMLRYSPQSVRFDDARPGPLDAIKPGDQFRARGTKNADGSEIAADQIVSGTFRNVAGRIVQVDAAGSTLVVKDLATKKPVTIHVAPDVQLRRIPEQMAQMLAARLKGTAPGATFAAGGARNWNGGAGPGGGRQTNAAGGPPSGAGAPGSGNGPWRGNGGPGAGDPQRFLSMAPAIKLADLQKGEAVMVVTSAGTSDVNAITLLAGVEPLLEAPAATDLLSNWSMGGGSAEAAAGTP